VTGDVEATSTATDAKTGDLLMSVRYALEMQASTTDVLALRKMMRLL
jgi:hypothetical protein